MKAKNIYSIGLLFMMLVSQSGCKKSYWIRHLTIFWLLKLFWKTESDAILAVNAAYPAVLDEGITLFQRDAFTDIGHVSSFFNTDALVEKIATMPQIQLLQRSGQTYGTEYLKQILYWIMLNQIPVSSKTVVNRVKGEAKVLRAYQYIKLASLFGDVPLVTKVLSISEGKTLTRTPVAQIWDL